MIITAIKAAAVIVFVGITVGLVRPAGDHDVNVQEQSLNSQSIYSELHPSVPQET
jgi:hypothetical protein